MSDLSGTRVQQSGWLGPGPLPEQPRSDGHTRSLSALARHYGTIDAEKLVEILRDDQRQRWGTRQGVDVRTYLRWFPVLTQGSEPVFELLYHEWLVREYNGETPDLDDFLKGFPEFAERLRLQLAVHRVLNCDGLEWEDENADDDEADASTSVEIPGSRQTDENIDRLPSLPGYEILDELGRGGMGVVYRAMQLKPRRPVALKMILAGRFASEQMRLRFQNEAESVAALSHPNIVPILELGRHKWIHYFSMALIEGGTLAERLESFRADSRAAAKMLVEVCSAVSHAHQRGVLHRDLKPSNILLDENGRPYVTDFGLAKREQAPGELTQTGLVIGSPGYMSPEQAAGDAKKFTTATDVYGLGAIFYALLTGRPPFEGGSAGETLYHLRNRAPVSPSQLNPKVPAPLEVICLKCLEKDPARRYSSADLLAADLKCWLEGKPIKARPVPAWVHAWLWAKRSPALALMTLTLSCTLLAGFMISGALWYRAESSLRDARAAEAKERRVRLEAQTRFSVAINAIRDYYAGVRDSVWLTEPGDNGGRLRLLTLARTYYQKLQASLAGDTTPLARAQLAAAYVELATVTLETREPNSESAAASTFDEAIAIRRQLANASPNEPSLRLDLATTLSARGRAERSRGLDSEAERSFEAASAILEKLSNEPSVREKATSDLSWSLGNIAAIRGPRGDMNEALRLHERVLEIRQRLVNEHPENIAYRSDQAWVMLDIAGCYRAAGRLDLAIETARRGLKMLESIRRENPKNVGVLEKSLPFLEFIAAAVGEKKDKAGMLRASESMVKVSEWLVQAHRNNPRSVLALAGHYAVHSRRLAGVGEVGRARVARAQAIALYERLARLYPGADRVQRDLARCLFIEARLAFYERAYAVAHTSSERAADLRLASLRAKPHDHEFAAIVIEGLVFHMQVLYRLGRGIEVPSFIERAESVMPPLNQTTAGLYYDIACMHALAMKFDPDPSRANRAMKFLRQGIEGGYRDGPHIRNDSDLVSLHDRAEYQLLMRDLGFPSDPFQR